MDSRVIPPSHPSMPAEGGADLMAARLDELRGLGIALPSWPAEDLQRPSVLADLVRRLADALEGTQRRAIEASIQLLSLRELVAKLLSLRSPEDVVETVALYLHKAFDHERVLAGIYDRERGTLEGWVALRNGVVAIHPFSLAGDWGGALRDCVESGRPSHGHGREGRPLLTGAEGSSLAAFAEVQLGGYRAYPLSARGPGHEAALGILAVGSGAGRPGISAHESAALEAVADAVGAALANLLLQEDVRREEAFRKDIVTSMVSGLVAVDLEGRVLSLNPRAEALTGFALASVRGSAIETLDPTAGGVADLLRAALRTREVGPRQERAVRRADGRLFPAACTASPLRNPEGTVYGALVLFDDLTSLKAMEEHIRSLDRLAALGRFTAGVAHEIRNPLAGIGAGVQYLERHLEPSAENRENFEFIDREIHRLDRIVEDLFRVTHPQPVRRTPTAPAGLLIRTLRALGPLPLEKGVQITTGVDADLPEVPVDPDQIQQVLLNLVKNAVEATPAGGTVAVGARRAAHAGEERLVFEIRDSGPGIDPETRARLFEPFFTKGKSNGTGLGLYVSHGIVQRHGGEIHATSPEGGGAVFTLELPLRTFDVTESPS